MDVRFVPLGFFRLEPFVRIVGLDGRVEGVMNMGFFRCFWGGGGGDDEIDLSGPTGMHYGGGFLGLDERHLVSHWCQAD